MILVITKIAVPGALGYKVRFDYRSSTQVSTYAYAYLNLYQDATLTTYWGSPYYGGISSTGAWNSENTLIIYSSSFLANFDCYLSYSYYGFKMYITPIYETPLPQQVQLPQGSMHDYLSKMNVYNNICVPGAVNYTVTFSAETSLASGSYLTFYTNTLQLNYYGRAQYTGLAPDLSSLAPILIPAESFGVKFVSSSTQAYGYALSIIPKFGVTINCFGNSTASNYTVAGSYCMCYVGNSHSFGNTVLSHRYSFDNSTVYDSVTGATGSLQSYAYVCGGQLTLNYVSTSTIYPYAQLQPNLYDAGDPITVEVWLSTGTNSDRSRIFQFGSSLYSNSNSIVLCRSSSGYFSVQIYSGTEVAFAIVSEASFDKQNEIYVTVTVTNDLTPVVSLYINGVLSKTGTSSYPLPSASAGGYLGKSFLSTDKGLIGIINELRIWNGVMTATDVQKSYISGYSELVCSLCEVNSYASRVGQSSCTPCPSNSFTYGVGTVLTCICNEGYNTSGTGDSLQCTQCAGGTYSPVGTYSCSTCGNGSYAPAGSGGYIYPTVNLVHFNQFKSD